MSTRWSEEDYAGPPGQTARLSALPRGQTSQACRCQSVLPRKRGSLSLASASRVHAHDGTDPQP